LHLLKSFREALRSLGAEIPRSWPIDRDELSEVRHLLGPSGETFASVIRDAASACRRFHLQSGGSNGRRLIDDRLRPWNFTGADEEWAEAMAAVERGAEAAIAKARRWVADHIRAISPEVEPHEVLAAALRTAEEACDRMYAVLEGAERNEPSRAIGVIEDLLARDYVALRVVPEVEDALMSLRPVGVPSIWSPAVGWLASFREEECPHLTAHEAAVKALYRLRLCLDYSPPADLRFRWAPGTAEPGPGRWVTHDGRDATPAYEALRGHDSAYYLRLKEDVWKEYMAAMDRLAGQAGINSSPPPPVTETSAVTASPAARREPECDAEPTRGSTPEEIEAFRSAIARLPFGAIQRQVVDAIVAESGSINLECLIASIPTWDCEAQWKSCARDLNKKLRPVGWEVGQDRGHATIRRPRSGENATGNATDITTNKRNTASHAEAADRTAEPQKPVG
jgi:hypothetical protein